MRRELLDRLKNEKYESDIRDYLTELIYLKYSPFRYTQYLDRLELTPLERKILQYNLTIKAINAIGDNLPENSKMEVNNYDRFSIEAGSNYDWEIINMIFAKNMKVTYYDRTKLLKDKFDLANKLDELEEEYEHNYKVYYGHIDNTDEEIELKTKIEDLKNRLFDLSLMVEDKSIFILDQIIKEELSLPTNEVILKNSSEIYNTYDVTNNRNIKVYKKTIRK